MNAVAGGGTLLTFPALMAFGMPAIPANATSTFALVAGMVGSKWGYRNQLASTKRHLGRFGLVSLAGGLVGAWLLTVTGEALFDFLVPYLLLFATVLFTAGTFFQPTTVSGRRHMVLAVIAQFLVAVYGGYFGAGIGILMLAVLGWIGLRDIHEMNALKTVLAALINGVAATYFVFAGLVVWREAGLMTLGAAVGYFLGAHSIQKIPQTVVRWVITAVGLAITAMVFLRGMRVAE
jgi:hypothetical protein